MTHVTRRQALARMAAATTAMTAGACARAATGAPGRRPNIIFILADDLGYGDLGCYGQERIATPNIDALAAEGIRFTQCYSGSTVCAPSRCCLMTGRHTGHATIRGNLNVPLRPEDVTVAEILRDAGYRTGLVGKWGLGEPDTTGIPNRKGFDYFFGYLNQSHAHNYYPEYLWRNEERVPLEGNRDAANPKNVSEQCAVYSHDLFTREALEFVEREKDHPFFLYLAYTIPHANNERGAAEGNGMEVPDLGPYADKDWPAPQKGHAAMIARMDADIGKIMERLKTLGIDENTVVFFSSDNGTHKEGGADPAFFKSSGPLRGYKRDLYEGGIRVPMLARWPGNIAPGAVSDAAWAFWDFLPTAAAIAGANAPNAIDGVNALPALLGKSFDSERPLYWEFHEKGFARAARQGKWKALWKDPAEPLELYDLDADRGEQHDVAAAHRDIAARLRTFIEGARTPSERWPGK